MGLPKIKKNPWRTLGSKRVYQNQWIKVREDQVITPDGQKGIYGMIEIKPSAGIIALAEKKEIYLVGQWRYTHRKYSWEIPTGGAKPNEKLLATAKRELLEETGLIAKKWISLGTIDNSNGYTNDVVYLFLARKLKKTKPKFEPTEKLKIIKIPFQKAVQLVMENQITDSISVAGILKAKECLQ